MELGYLQTAQLEAALRLQERDDAERKPRRPLGIICMQEGYMTYNQVVAVLERQESAVVLG